MTKTVVISDDVSRRLQRERDDRSVREVIETALDRGGQIADVAGQGIFDTETDERVNEKMTQLDRGTVDGMAERDASQTGRRASRGRV